MSGTGTVARHCAFKLMELGAKVLSLSDSKGCIFKEDGLSKEDLDKVGLRQNVHLIVSRQTIRLVHWDMCVLHIAYANLFNC